MLFIFFYLHAHCCWDWALFIDFPLICHIIIRIYFHKAQMLATAFKLSTKRECAASACYLPLSMYSATYIEEISIFFFTHGVDKESITTNEQFWVFVFQIQNAVCLPTMPEISSRASSVLSFLAHSQPNYWQIWRYKGQNVFWLYTSFSKEMRFDICDLIHIFEQIATHLFHYMMIDIFISFSIDNIFS